MNTGVFSNITTIRPIRLNQMVDKSVPHLQTCQLAAYLCSVRTLYHLVTIMEKTCLLERLEPGRFWCANKEVDPCGRPKPLLPQTLSKLVVRTMNEAGITVASEDANDETGKDSLVKLAGHFLRGHAGSLAFDLAKNGAHWTSDEGINRARHSFPTFFKNYYRATKPRIIIAAAAAQAQGKKLRFEEASRL